MIVTPEEQEKRLNLYRQGFNDIEIGKQLGVSRECIVIWRRKNGLPSIFKSRHKQGKKKLEIPQNEYFDNIPPRGIMPKSVREKLGFFEL